MRDSMTRRSVHGGPVAKSSTLLALRLWIQYQLPASPLSRGRHS